jgi:hypothetical protein
MKVVVLIAVAVALAGCGTESTGGGSDVGTDPGGAGIGMSVQEALLVELDAPTLVSGYLIESGGTLKLCESLQESSPPGCGEPSLTIEGSTLDDRPRGELVDVNGTVQGTTLTPVDAG